MDSLDTVDIGSLVDALKADNVNERIAYRKANAAGAEKRGRDQSKIMVTQLKGFDEGKDNFMPNPNVGFKSMNYVCSESVGTLEIKICKKVQEELVFVVKTLDGSATQPKKYERVEEIVKMTKTQNEHIVKVNIVDDDDYNEDQDFYVEICNEEGQKLEGDDCSTRITIKDEDKPGEIGFDKKKYTVRKMDKYAYIQLVRRDGSTGEASCYCKTEVLTKQVNNQAEEFTDFMPFNDPVTFKNGETEHLMKVELVNDEQDKPETATKKNDDDADKSNDKSKDNEDEDDQKLVFQLVLENPSPSGVTIAKQNMCYVEIVPDNEEVDEQQEAEFKMLNFLLDQQEQSWAGQFKKALILGPSLDSEEGDIDEIDGEEAFFHFWAMGWKLVFATIPPPKYCNGWAAFTGALIWIGLVTLIVGEFANLIGCCFMIPQSVTAITIVALGTSLPDTFASVTAARQSKNADSAVGNITGSNSVNVFLGLGLPWTVACIYY